MHDEEKLNQEEEKELMQDETYKKVQKIVIDQLGIEGKEVKPKDNIINDLGADSLDTVELVMALEEAFDIEIPDEVAEKIKTVEDAVTKIKEQVSAKA